MATVKRYAPKGVSVEWLHAKGACKSKQDNFLAVFGGKEIPLNRKNLLIAAKHKMELDWLAEKLFGGPRTKRYREYIRNTNKAYKNVGSFNDKRKAMAFFRACATEIHEQLKTMPRR